MRRRRARRTVDQYLRRTLEVRSARPYVSVHPMGNGRGAEPRIECGSWLDIQGDLDSPVKDVFDVTIQVQPEDPLRVGTVRPVAVGSVIGISSTVSVVVALLPADFDRLWTLALSDRLRFASLTLTPPKHGSSRVIDAGFSSERGE